MIKLFCFQGQILCLSRLEETVKDAEIIFEAVIDDLQVKQDLFESECNIQCIPMFVSQKRKVI